MNTTLGNTLNETGAIENLVHIGQHYPKLTMCMGALCVLGVVFRKKILGCLIDPIPKEAKREAADIIRGQSHTASLLQRYVDERFTWTLATTYIVQLYVKNKLFITLEKDIHDKLLLRYQREMADLREKQRKRMKLFGTISGLQR